MSFLQTEKIDRAENAREAPHILIGQPRSEGIFEHDKDKAVLSSAKIRSQTEERTGEILRGISDIFPVTIDI